MEGTVLLKLRPLLERLFCVVGHVGWLWRGNVCFFSGCVKDMDMFFNIMEVGFKPPSATKNMWVKIEKNT